MDFEIGSACHSRWVRVRVRVVAYRIRLLKDGVILGSMQAAEKLIAGLREVSLY